MEKKYPAQVHRPFTCNGQDKKPVIRKLSISEFSREEYPQTPLDKLTPLAFVELMLRVS